MDSLTRQSLEVWRDCAEYQVVQRTDCQVATTFLDVQSSNHLHNPHTAVVDTIHKGVLLSLDMENLCSPIHSKKFIFFFAVANHQINGTIEKIIISIMLLITTCKNASMYNLISSFTFCTNSYLSLCPFSRLFCKIVPELNRRRRLSATVKSAVSRPIGYYCKLLD